MGSPCPPHWTFAARAAYFGDRMCAFCAHRNPAGAKFCNECAAPLEPERDGGPSAGESAPASASPGDRAVMDMPQPAVVEPPPGPTVRSPGTGSTISMVATALVLALAFGAYRIAAPTPKVPDVASPSGDDAARDTSAAVPLAPVAADPVPAASGQPAESQPSILGAHLEVSTPVRAQRRVVASSNKKTPGAHPRAASAHPPQAAKSRVPHRVPSTPVRGRSTQAQSAVPPASTRLARENPARCDGDLLTRIVCEQRARNRACEGRWGSAPECAVVIASDHGQ